MAKIAVSGSQLASLHFLAGTQPGFKVWGANYRFIFRGKTFVLIICVKQSFLGPTNLGSTI